jgi:2-iminobutanoate/2-iminopropanoate deaminase
MGKPAVRTSKTMNIRRYLIVASSAMLGAVALVYGSLTSDVSAQTKNQKKSVIDVGEMQTLTNEAGVPISVAVADDTYVYVSALAPFDLKTRTLVTGSIEDQAENVLRNLETVLQAADTSLDKVVNVTVYVAGADKATFDSFNRVFKKYFPKEPPTRNWVPITGFPLGQDLEVAAIALR